MASKSSFRSRTRLNGSKLGGSRVERNLNRNLSKKDSKILDAVRYTMMKGLNQMKGNLNSQTNRNSPQHKSANRTLWTLKSFSDIEEIEEKFSSQRRMNFNFFSKELIYYTCEFCLLRCIFHHKFTKKFPVALKFLQKAIENAPQDVEPNNLNLMIKLNLYIAKM